MMRLTIAAVFAACAVSAASAQSTDVTLVRAPSAATFEASFCGADRSGAAIFVIPLNIFEDGGEIACDHGTSATRMVEPADDPGHVVLNVDPPAGVADGFDCDAKADIGMFEVALNCLPANAEAADHRNP